MSDKKKVPARILVVDDETAARSALTELLREEGYEVQSAGDGFKALGRLDGWTPHIVITDLKMPGMDGIQLMEKLRERIADVSVVVMTAFGTVESAVEAIQQGAGGCLTGPLPLGQVPVVVERVPKPRAWRQEAERLRGGLARRDGVEPEPDYDSLTGRSRAFREMMSLV